MMNKKEKSRTEMCLIFLFIVIALIIGNAIKNYTLNEELEKELEKEENANMFAFYILGIILSSIIISGIIILIIQSFIFKKEISEEVTRLKLEELVKKRGTLKLDIKKIKEKKELLNEIIREIEIRILNQH